MTRTTKITSLQIICINILYKDNWKFCGHLVYKDSGIILSSAEFYLKPVLREFSCNNLILHLKCRTWVEMQYLSKTVVLESAVHGILCRNKWLTGFHCSVSCRESSQEDTIFVENKHRACYLKIFVVWVLMQQREQSHSWFPHIVDFLKR